MAEYKTVTVSAHKLDDETTVQGRERWHRRTVEPHPTEKDKIIIEFMRD